MGTRDSTVVAAADDFPEERTRSNIGKRGFFYFSSTLSLVLYLIIPLVALASFAGFLALNFKTEQDRIDYLQHFGNSAFNLTSTYSGKMIGLMNANDQVSADQTTEMVTSKLRSFFTFTEMKYAFIVTCIIGLVIYMRVVVMTRLIIFTWLRRWIMGATPDDFMLVDFLTLKKKRSFENVKTLIDQLLEISKIKIQDVDSIFVDTTNANDRIFEDLMTHFHNGKKKDAKVISLCGMNISSFNLVKDTLPKKSRGLIVTNDGNDDTTVILVSNNPKDAKISKYIFVKSETILNKSDDDSSSSNLSTELKNSKCSHFCSNTNTENKLNIVKKELEETVSEPSLKSFARFGAATTSFNGLEFIDNKRKGKRNDLILQMNGGTNTSTRIVWRVI